MRLTTLRSLLNHCVKEGDLGRNVASAVSTVREDKTDLTKQSLTVVERIIGSDEVWKLINCAKELELGVRTRSPTPQNLLPLRLASA